MTHARVLLRPNRVSPLLRSEEILRSDMVCVMSASHPLTDRRITMKGYLAYPHIMVTVMSGERTMVDEQRAAAGHRRRIGLRVPYFGSAVLAAENNTVNRDRIPHRGERYTRESRMRIKTSPFKFQPIRILSWHISTDAEPSLQWFRRSRERHFKAACMSCQQPFEEIPPGLVLAQSGHRPGRSGTSVFRGKADVADSAHSRPLLTQNQTLARDQPPTSDPTSMLVSAGLDASTSVAGAIVGEFVDRILQQRADVSTFVRIVGECQKRQPNFLLFDGRNKRFIGAVVIERIGHLNISWLDRLPQLDPWYRRGSGHVTLRRMALEYECWRSRDNLLHLMCVRDRFEELLQGIRSNGPWAGSVKGRVDDLKMHYRLLLLEQGFIIFYRKPTAMLIERYERRPPLWLQRLSLKAHQS